MDRQSILDVLDSVDACSIARLVASGAVSADAVIEHFIRNVEDGEPRIHAFASFDPQKVRADLKRLSLGAETLPMAGMPIGVKDIFDTVDHRTEYFSPIYRGNQPTRNADVVTTLLSAGGTLAGKTHTTEFAYMHTGPTQNPHRIGHTPGSSSAGSAAGVAANFFPLALGTQTAGSVIKPASYCGVFAFKPSFGSVSLRGVKRLAPSFDTVGWFGRSVDDLALMANVLLPSPADRSPTIRTRRFAYLPEFEPARASLEVMRAVSGAVETLRGGGHEVVEIALPPDFRTACGDHQVINDVEGARSLSYEAAHHADQLSPEALAMLARASATDEASEQRARQRLASLRPVLASMMSAFDAILLPSCGVTAPRGLEATGPSDFIKIWMAFGLPQLTIPLSSPVNALPIGLQMVGFASRDHQLLGEARAVAELVGHHRWKREYA